MPDAAAPLAPSGIGPVEVVWGGFARPGAYLLVGAARHGRHHLAAQAAGGALAAGESVLIFSGREPAAVAGLAREAGVDLADAYRQGRARLLRVPAPQDLAALGEDGLRQALADLAAAAQGAARVVIEDFTPFVQFRSFDAFAAAFRRLVADVAARGATLVLGLGEPANDGSRRLLAFVQAEVTGTLHLRADEGGVLLAMHPGRGHAGLAHEAAWSPGAPAAPRPSLFAEAPLVQAEAPPEAPAFFADHGADGFGGTDAARLDAGALVASAAPSEPFGPIGGAADPAALGLNVGATPAPFDLDTFAEGPAPEAAPPVEMTVARTPVPEDPFATDPFGTDPFADDPFGEEPFADAPTEAPAVQIDDVPEAILAVVPTAAPEAEPEAAPEAFDAFGALDAASSDGASWDIEGAALMPVELGPPAPVVVPPGLDPLGPGYLVDSDDAGVAPEAQVNQWAAEATLPGGLPSPAPPVPPVAGDEDPEAAFRDDLAAAFATRAQAPFLVLAVRVDPASGFAAAFPAVADGLLNALTAADRALVRDDEARLVALLPGAGTDAPQRLLGAVHAHLRVVLGADADAALRAVGVLALPDGQPFTAPEELLAYALG